MGGTRTAGGGKIDWESFAQAITQEKEREREQSTWGGRRKARKRDRKRLAQGHIGAPSRPSKPPSEPIPIPPHIGGSTITAGKGQG